MTTYIAHFIIESYALLFLHLSIAAIIYFIIKSNEGIDPFGWKAKDFDDPFARAARINAEHRINNRKIAIEELNELVSEINERFAQHNVKSPLIQDLEDRFNRYKQMMKAQIKEYDSQKPSYYKIKEYDSKNPSFYDHNCSFLKKTNFFRLFSRFNRNVDALEREVEGLPDDLLRDDLVLGARMMLILQHLIAIDDFIVNHGQWDETLYLLGAR